MSAASSPPGRDGGRWTRREFLHRAGLVGLAAGVGGPVVTACGEDAGRRSVTRRAADFAR